MAVRHTLEKWEEDPTIRQSVTQEIDLLDTLLLHELVEVALDETTELPPMAAHIVATSFERCLKDSILAMAIKVFFVDWQPSALKQESTREEPRIENPQAPEKDEIDVPRSDNIADTFAASATKTPPTPERKRFYTTETKGNPDGKSVIVIDDSIMIRRIVSDVVVKMGHNIIEAADGLIGIPLIKSCKPDLIVLDLIMAEKGGMETLKELRSDPNFKTTPIIMLTIESNPRVIREVLTWGVNDYLVKPIGSKKLKERIAAQLNLR
jgi:two-component system, chemotaxis family, chemotaxis protein CheY